MKLSVQSEDIVENVKGTMDDTVTMVKQSFDIRHQVDQHPWFMLGASVVAGRILANFLHNGRESRGFSPYAPYPQNSRSVADVSKDAGLTAMYSVAGDEGVTNSSQPPVNPQPQQQQSWGHTFGVLQEEFVDVMKGAVLSTVMGTAREMIRQNMPNIIAPFDKMVDKVSKKLGTESLVPHTNGEQTTGNSDATEKSQSPSGSYGSFGSMQGGEPYGRVQ
ncbi:MAG: hypothetical protein HYX67_08410 [Candidatus Melainabacteria bacterium]|nr:hypothetical protein [Candidatus Melainabacteria bacterium]